jgi:FkbM family methyltransferase
MKFIRSLRLWGEAIAAGRMRAVYHRSLMMWGRSNPMKVLLVGLVRRGDVVLDVGANRGIFTALLSNLVGEQGQVHAFEPSPDTCRLLRGTLDERARHPENVTVNIAAVGTDDGTATLFTPKEDHGQASLRTHDTGSWSERAPVSSAEVTVTRLDSYTAKMKLSRIHVVKMDVEGAELLAVAGFASGLSSMHPIVACELCGAWTAAFDYEPSAVIGELRKAGYDMFHLVTAEGQLRRIIDFRLVNDGESHDLVASVARAHASRIDPLVR